jgi:hypothetical protein
MRNVATTTRAVIFSGFPSFTSTDKSVCATLILPQTGMLLQARARAALILPDRGMPLQTRACATPFSRSAQVLLQARVSVAQTLLSVLWQRAAADIHRSNLGMTAYA